MRLIWRLVFARDRLTSGGEPVSRLGSAFLPDQAWPRDQIRRAVERLAWWGQPAAHHSRWAACLSTVAELSLSRVKDTDGSVTAKRLLPAPRAAG